MTRFHTLDVFTRTPFGGNQLAVVTDAGALDEAAMRRIAREFNLSETVFLVPATRPEATHRMRIFTPGMELPFAGHPTVGTAVLLALLGEVPLDGAGTGTLVLEQQVGLVRVAVRVESKRVGWARLTAARDPERGPAAPARDGIAAMLGLAEPDVLGDAQHAPERWSAGTPFLIVPVADPAALGRVRFDRARWEPLLAGSWAPHVYVFSPDPEHGAGAFRARMFAPEMGIPEDPATGAAATAVAGYLAARERGSGPRRWTVRQGVEMGRPSLLEVEAEVRDGAARRVSVSGSAVRMADGTLRL